MTTDKQPIDINDSKSMPFGKRLQSAREAIHLERKDVAAQLRLNERIIFMMEKNRYSADIPVTFIRGYLRSYAKFLNIPEYEVNKAVEHIKAKPISQQPPAPNTKPIVIGSKSSHYFMHIFTFLIVVTLIGLIGSWWYTQNPPSTISTVSSQPISNPNTLMAPLAAAPSPAETTPETASVENQPASTESPTSPANKIVANNKHDKHNTQSDDYDDNDDVD